MELNSEFERLQKYAEIDSELKRAETKHPDWPDDMFRQLAIMQEEAGEVTKAVLHYHYECGSFEHIKEELIQTASMCIRMLNNLKPIWIKSCDREPSVKGFYTVKGLNNQGNPVDHNDKDKIFFSGISWIIRDGCKVTEWLNEY